MKINIVYDFIDTPTGGTNQFLKALKEYFKKNNIYTEDENKTDVFLFIAYKFTKKVIRLKKKFPEKIFIQRIDGPVRLYSGEGDKRDFITNYANKFIADGTIFQTEWSRKSNIKLGLQKNKFETTIINAPNNNIFNRINKAEFNKNKKTKIIISSWSSNFKKGFKVYKWIDENFDFNKYEITFCGNSPIKFQNIKHIKPLPSKDLAEILKNNDIYITASQKDPCSNSLIEALHCGLPAIALNDGGHPEIIKNAGEIFNEKKEIVPLLNKIEENYSFYQKNMTLPSINNVGDKYYDFLLKIYNFKKNGTHFPKRIGFAKSLILYYHIYRHKFLSSLKKTLI